MGGKVQMIFEGDEKNLVQSLEKSRAKIQELERKFADLKSSGGRAGRGIGESMAIGAVAAKGLQMGIDAVTQSFEFMAQEADRGARAMEKLEAGYKSLIQVSLTPEQFRAMSGMAQSIAMTGVDPAMAQEMVFAAKSQQVIGDIGLFAKSAQFMDPLAGIESVGKFKSAFGSEEAGSSRSLLNKFLRAAFNADVTVDAIARASVAAAQPAASLGGSDEEMLAFMSVLSPAFKSPDTAAFRIARFAALAESGGSYERVTPEIEAARGRYKGIQAEQGAIDSRMTAISRERAAAQLELDEYEAGIPVGKISTTKRRERDLLRRQLEVRTNEWRREELALRTRNDALEAEAAELKPATQAEKIKINLKGKGLRGALRALMEMTPEARNAVLGESIQGRAAYQAMTTNLPMIDERIAELNAAAVEGEGDDFAIRFGISSNDPDLRALRRKTISENQRSLGAMSRGGRRRLAAEEAINRIVEASQDKGESGFQTWMRSQFAGLAMKFSGDPATIRNFAGGGLDNVKGDPTGSAFDDLRKATENLDRAAGKLEGALKQAPNPNAGDLD